MNNRGQRVLLTGGAGFIGSHLAEALLQQGYQLTIVDNLDPFYPSTWKKSNLEDIRQAGACEFYEVDICEMERLSHVMTVTRPEIVIHLAARAGVRPSIEQPQMYERTNVAGTLNLLELCRKFHVDKFIFGSSSSVYGATSCVPFSENQVELQPLSPYAATKLAGEMLAYTYAHLFGLPVICLRFFTVYGPRQRPDLAIYKFTRLIEAGEPVPIFGNGSTARDYTYVEDIVAGVLAGLNYELRPSSGRAPFETFNLGNSHPVKLAELVELLESVIGRKAIPERRALQPGDAPLTWADISKASRVLGYRPVTPLKEGLASFVKWYRAVRPLDSRNLFPATATPSNERLLETLD
ncbi:MAG TPA: GDP-mannose 4,6-dehydratase [Terriglobales bacterium]|nr:GDP-mannose 4,6-dehydratase [Terriglobales bacterium]